MIKIISSVVALVFTSHFANASPGLSVDAQDWSDPIQESGKDSNGSSSYSCSNGMVLIGMQHSGDENGSTQYKCGRVSYNGVSLYTTDQERSDAIQESGADSGGSYSYICADPEGSSFNGVLVGRSHYGDENGETYYQCANLRFGGISAVIDTTDWSDWQQESGKDGSGTSSFTCPQNQILVGRSHRGDENGDTRYMCADVYVTQTPVYRNSNSAGSKIQESGKDNNGTSTFQCPTNKVMTTRQHWGDENGDTQYSCANLANEYNKITVSPGGWSTAQKESGKDNDDKKSSYTCPANQAMVGRKHSGDENGDTQYQCGTLSSSDGGVVSVIASSWSSWIQESAKDYSSGKGYGTSYYQCKNDKFMIGREHSGDENGNTRYLCGIAVVSCATSSKTSASLDSAGNSTVTDNSCAYQLEGKPAISAWTGTASGKTTYVAEVNLQQATIVVPNSPNYKDKNGNSCASENKKGKDGQVWVSPLYTVKQWQNKFFTSNRLAVNANWFDVQPPFDTPHTNSCTNINGYSVSNGQTVSPADRKDKGKVYLDALIFSQESIDGNVHTLGSIVPYDEIDNFISRTPAQQAVAGFIIAQAGEVLPQDQIASSDSPKIGAARTAVGISKDGLTLFFVVVQHGAGNGGIRYDDMAQYVLDLGANDVINLDNSGSSQFYYSGDDKELSTPAGDAEGTRPVPNFLGVQ